MVVLEKLNENISNPLYPLRTFRNPDYKYPLELVFESEHYGFFVSHCIVRVFDSRVVSKSCDACVNAFFHSSRK